MEFYKIFNVIIQSLSVETVLIPSGKQNTAEAWPTVSYSSCMRHINGSVVLDFFIICYLIINMIITFRKLILQFVDDSQINKLR